MLALGALAATMAACSDDEPQRGESPVPNSDGVYFAAPATEDVDLTTDQTSFEVTIYREKKENELTVSLTTAMAEENAPFTVPTSVTFPAGVSEMTIDVAVDFANVEANKTYVMQISVGDAQGTPYALDAKTLNVVYAPWSDWKYMGLGTYTYACVWSLEDDEVPVYVRQSLVDGDVYQYRCGDVGDTSVPEADWYGMAYGVNYVIEYNKSTGAVTFAPTNTMFPYEDYGYVWCASVYDYAKIVPEYIGSMTLEQALSLNEFDDELGLFSINMRYYIGAQPTMGFTNAYEYLQLPGYTSYGIQINLNGHYVAENGDESQVVSIAMTSSLSEVKYNVYDGKLTEAQAEAKAKELAEDADALSVKEGGNISISVDPGTYTIVAAGLDETGTYRTYSYLTFDFESVKSDPNAGWTSKGMVTYTEDIMASVFQYPEVCTYSVEIQESDDTPGLYRLVNPYKSAWPYWDVYQDMSNGKDNYLVVNATDPTAVYIERSPMNYILEGDALVISSYAYELLLNGAGTLAQLKASGYCGTLVDGKITMPVTNANNKKGPILWVGEEGFYYANSNGKFCIDFNGEGEEEEESIVLKSMNLPKAYSRTLQGKREVKRKRVAGRVISSDEWLKSRKAFAGRMF